MTPEQKQQKLREWLPEIAKACGFDESGWIGPLLVVAKNGANPQSFDPVRDDRDSTYMRRVMGLAVIFVPDDKPFVAVEWIGEGHPITEHHDGTPDSMGAAERWAAIQAAAKKLGLE